MASWHGAGDARLAAPCAATDLLVEKGIIMTSKAIVVAAVWIGFLAAGTSQAQEVSNEQEFQQMSAALKANDAERQSAIATCISQGIGPDPAGAAGFMGVPVERATEAWCTRMTNGIANGALTLADLKALNEGTVTSRAQAVLTTASEGK
ncbi:hypothetical protein CDEF62S_00057 [Castellaniella defragrans]